MLKAKDHKFSNPPKKCSLENYKRAISYIIGRYSKIKNLQSIYSWGDISVPGISDIDIIFVFKKGTNNPLPFLKRGYYFLNPELRYILCHPFIFIDESSFNNVRYIYQHANFKLLCGKNMRLKNLSSSDNYHSSIALLNDIIIRHYPRDFLKQFINKDIDIRNTLLRLNSLRYSIKILEVLTKKKNKQWNHKLRIINKLRKTWLQAPDFDLLVSLNRNAIDISMEVIEKFTDFLIGRGMVKIKSGKSIKYNGIKNKSLFLKDWNKGKALQGMSKLIKNKQEFYSILPLELAPQLIEYSGAKGLISSYIKKNIGNSVAYAIRHKDIVNKRIEILNNQAILASKLKHSDFAAFFDFGYRNKYGINNLAIKLLDKLRF